MDGNFFNSYEKCRDPEYYYSDEAKSGIIYEISSVISGVIINASYFIWNVASNGII